MSALVRRGTGEGTREFDNAPGNGKSRKESAPQIHGLMQRPGPAGSPQGRIDDQLLPDSSLMVGLNLFALQAPEQLCTGRGGFSHPAT